jgi:hypothetical protein
MSTPCDRNGNVTSVTTCIAKQARISSIISKKLGQNQKKKLDKLLLELFTHDYQPFSIAEDRGFVNFTTVLNHSCSLPRRKITSSNMIPAAYVRCVNNVRETFSSVSSVCLTIDCWISRNLESYLAVTAHFITQEFRLMSILLGCASMDSQHTSVNLAAEVKRITDKFCLSNKVLVIATDNAANITNAIKTELGWKHFGCYAHTLNLIVQQALKSTTSILEKVEIIVTHFKRSTIASDKLLLHQEN